MTVLVRYAMPLLALAYLTPAWAQQPTLALVGGRIIDGYGGPPIENGVILPRGRAHHGGGPPERDRATRRSPGHLD